MENSLQKFKNFLEKRKYSNKTIQAYLTWISDFEAFFDGEDIESIDSKKVSTYLQSLVEKRKLARSSVKQAWSSLNLFYSNVAKRSLDLQPFKVGWVPRPIPSVPSQKDILKILKNVRNPNHKLAISLIYSMGLELGEALKIRITDIDLKNKYITIKLSRKRETRRAIIPDLLVEDIKKSIGNRKSNEYLFEGKTGNNITDSALQRAFTKAEKQSGIGKHYSIRSLRHAYIKHLEFLGIPLVNIIEDLKLSRNLSLDFYNKIGYKDIPITFSPLDREVDIFEDDQDFQSEPYVSVDRINDLAKIRSERFDLTRLIELLRELNICNHHKCYMSTSMILRSILDQIPPILGLETFNEVENNYSGSKSFRSAMIHLNNSLRNVADSYLHIRIRKAESIPTFQQVDFRSDLDMLLGEIVRILKQKA